MTSQLRKQGNELRHSFSERLAKAEAAERQCAELQAIVAGGSAGGAGIPYSLYPVPYALYPIPYN